ncbi:MAG: hypothetical protein KGJ57_18300 [Sphingomonadales bacterium]|nr:hypothetical protein [Sphingomonadales bacterium]MDE2171351.1 hypothetical protein [Sphingomonadales bacterium]
MHERHLTQHLRAILGDDGFVRFAQDLGGTRVYVPYQLKDDSDIVQAVGRVLADKLSRALAPATIRVPLARRERALAYRKQGLSDAAIARRLGITENGVGKLWSREVGLQERPGSARSAGQLDLFAE